MRHLKSREELRSIVLQDYLESYRQGSHWYSLGYLDYLENFDQGWKIEFRNGKECGEAYYLGQMDAKGDCELNGIMI